MIKQAKNNQKRRLTKIKTNKITPLQNRNDGKIQTKQGENS